MPTPKKINISNIKSKFWFVFTRVVQNLKSFKQELAKLLIAK